MDVMRWLPGLSYMEKVVTGQPVGENESLSMVMPIKIPQVSVAKGLTNYSLLERPSKISRAEKLGIPKGDRQQFNEFEGVMENARQFAALHNLKVPETLEEAKNMYREYNSFYRRVSIDQMPNGSVEMGKYASLPEKEQAKILASRGYPASKYTFDPNDFGNFFWDKVFVSPNLEKSKMYENIGGYLVKVQRPINLSNMKRAHISAEFSPKFYENQHGKLKKVKYYKHKIH